MFKWNNAAVCVQIAFKDGGFFKKNWGKCHQKVEFISSVERAKIDVFVVGKKNGVVCHLMASRMEASGATSGPRAAAGWNKKSRISQRERALTVIV